MIVPSAAAVRAILCFRFVLLRRVAPAFFLFLLGVLAVSTRVVGIAGSSYWVRNELLSMPRDFLAERLAMTSAASGSGTALAAAAPSSSQSASAAGPVASPSVSTSTSSRVLRETRSVVGGQRTGRPTQVERLSTKLIKAGIGRKSRAGKRASTTSFSNPKDRRPMEHKAISATMHRGKLAKQNRRAIESRSKELQKIVTHPKVMIRVKCSIVKSRHGRDLRIRFGDEHKWVNFSTHQMLQIATEKTTCGNALARTYGCDPRHIRRVKSVVSWGLITLQELMFGWVLCRCREHPPDYGGRSRLWDETTQRLFMAVSKNMSNSAAINTWQILVARVRLVWGWTTSRRPNQTLPIMSWEPLVPAVPLLSNEASHLYSGLEAHAALAPLHQFCLSLKSIIIENGGRWFDLAESDGATANEKFQAAVEVEDQSGWLGCGNHSNHLGQMNVVNVGDYKKASSEVVEDPKPEFNVVNDIYASILFVRMNGHFMRLMVVLRSTLRSKVVVRKGPPPPRAVAYSQAFRSMLEAEQLFSGNYSPDSPSFKRFCEVLTKFFSLFNGRLWLRGGQV